MRPEQHVRHAGKPPTAHDEFRVAPLDGADLGEPTYQIDALLEARQQPGEPLGARVCCQPALLVRDLIDEARSIVDADPMTPQPATPLRPPRPRRALASDMATR